MVRHMHGVADEILHTAGAEMVPSSPDAHDPPGAAIHEHGTVRMGDDPARSVLNRFNRMHEVDNVLVVDGSSFTSASEKNPTLTSLAPRVAGRRLPARGAAERAAVTTRAGIGRPVATRPGSRGGGGDGQLPASVRKRATREAPGSRGGGGGGQVRPAETRPSAIRPEAGERAAVTGSGRPDVG